MKKFKLACIGNFGFDYIKYKNNYKKIVGGSGFRFTTVMALFKQPVCLYTSLGKEREIRNILHLFKKDVVKVIFSKTNKSPLFIIHYKDKNKVRKFKTFYYKKNSQNLLKLVKKSSLTSFNWIHICPLDLSIVKKILKKSSSNATISLQLHLSLLDSYIYKDWEKLFNKVDYLFASKEDFSFLGKGWFKKVKLLSKKIKKNLFLTLGDKGIIVFTKGRLSDKINSLDIKRVKDYTGAGDFFTAGTVLGLINFKNKLSSVRLGLLLSAISLKDWGSEILLNFLKNNENNKEK
jgi:sugar/nucleoside kinase (ribokinase family)